MCSTVHEEPANPLSPFRSPIICLSLFNSKHTHFQRCFCLSQTFYYLFCTQAHHVVVFRGQVLFFPYCASTPIFQDPGRSTSLHLKILIVQSHSNVRLCSCRDDFAPTKSVKQQEITPAQLGHRALLLKVVTHLAWNHNYSKCNYVCGHFPLLPAPFIPIMFSSKY